MEPAPSGAGIPRTPVANARPHGTGSVRLEVLAGNAVGMSILVHDELIIGRDAEGVGWLAHDEEISRSHARITYELSGYCGIEDLGSTNGTFVNGLRISGPRTVAEGDTIELGGTTLVVREVPACAPGPRGPSGSPSPLVLLLKIDFAAREARIERAGGPARGESI